MSETAAWTWRVSHSRSLFLAAAGAHKTPRSLQTVRGRDAFHYGWPRRRVPATSIAFLRVSPPMLRKFAAHAVLAGTGSRRRSTRARRPVPRLRALRASRNASGPEPSNGGPKNGPEALFRMRRDARQDAVGCDGARAPALRAQIRECGNSPAAAAHSRSSGVCGRRLRGATATPCASFCFSRLLGLTTRQTKEVSKDASNDDTRAPPSRLGRNRRGLVVVSFGDGEQRNQSTRAWRRLRRERVALEGGGSRIRQPEGGPRARRCEVRATSGATRHGAIRDLSSASSRPI